MSKSTAVVACLTVLCLLAMPPCGLAIELHVSPAGNDGHPGTAEQPLATLEGARNAIRKLRRDAQEHEPVRVVVAGGDYSLSRPFELTPQDSGTAVAPVIYEAAAGERPVFSGGRSIEGWQESDGGLWKVHLSDVAAGQWRFEQLWVNGQRATRARTPNKFYFYAQEVKETPAPDGSGKEAMQTIRMRPEDFATIAGLTQDDLRDVNLVVYHKWDNTRRFLETADADRSVITTSGRKMKSWNPIVKDSHFIFENFRAALDSPGEWFLDRDGWLYYHPRPGETIATLKVSAPIVDKFIVMEGDATAGEFIEHVTIRGLAFRHGQWLTPPEGFEPAQAAAPIDATVMVDGARNIVLDRCEFTNAGRYGIWFRKGCRECTVRQCLVEDVGAGGIRIGETRIADEGPERTSHITLDNNIIRRGGRIFPCAVGVWIGQSGDNRVTHNEIADFLYTGISAGWTWGYSNGLAKHNTIAFNHVHHIGQGVLSDMGGIYTLGPSEGTVVANNVFHDIYAYSYGGWGLYTDEGSTGVLFENNLVYGTKTGSFHQHYGKENVVRNNILAFSELHQLQATRPEEHLSFVFERNIVVWDRGELLSGPWDKVKFDGGRNLFWQSKGQPVTFAGNTLEQWQAKGHEQGSLIADPRFADPAAHDFTIPADSPAISLGFVPFDPAKVGVYGDAEWQRLARDADYPALEVAPSPP